MLSRNKGKIEEIGRLEGTRLKYLKINLKCTVLAPQDGAVYERNV